jgi:hypothetical protein
MSDFVDKIVNGKYYLSIQEDVTPSWGGVWLYSFDCYIATKKQLQNLIKEEKNEGWIKLNLVRAIKKDKDSWLCYVKGVANGGLPLDHKSILQSISKVLEQK